MDYSPGTCYHDEQPASAWRTSMGRPRKLLSVGSRYGRLVVVSVAHTMGRNSASLCRCDCGNEKLILNQNLTKRVSSTQSCGCLSRERASERVKSDPPRLKHGLRKSSTYSCWVSMVSRCHNPKDTNYPRYGARGIFVCDRWRDCDFGATRFVEDMGHRPSSAHSIDRIDGSKGYNPENCRWATRSQQNQNVGIKKNNTTGYKGINRDKKKWVASIRSDGNRVHLGSYNSKEEAALAYNIASSSLQGIYGQRNSLPPMPKDVTNRVFENVQKILNNTGD